MEKDALFLLGQRQNIIYALFHFENSMNMQILCLGYLWLNRNYYVVFERLFFLSGFVAHDPMVRKLPTRRFVDYPQKNRYQVTVLVELASFATVFCWAAVSLGMKS